VKMAAMLLFEYGRVDAVADGVKHLLLTEEQ
jgi:hypothetical protein